MLAVVALVGVAAATTTQLFVVAFGRITGSITAFSFFMFQIFAFGGIFPLGTIPSVSRHFKDISPMTFARRAIIRCDITLYDQMFWVSVTLLVLAIIGVVAAAVFAEHLRAQAKPEPVSATQGVARSE